MSQVWEMELPGESSNASRTSFLYTRVHSEAPRSYGLGSLIIKFMPAFTLKLDSAEPSCQALAKWLGDRPVRLCWPATCQGLRSLARACTSDNPESVNRRRPMYKHLTSCCTAPPSVNPPTLPPTPSSTTHVDDNSRPPKICRSLPSRPAVERLGRTPTT